MKRALSIVSFLILLAVLGALKVEQYGRRDVIRLSGRVTFVPKPEAIKAMSLGYDHVVADMIWIRAIQYYGANFTTMRKNPEDWLKLARALHVLRPNSIKVHEFVASAIAEGLREPDVAIQYLDDALLENPGAYSLPYHSAMYAALVKKDKRLAAEYMCKAARTNRVVPAMITVSNVRSATQSTPFQNLGYPRLSFSPGRIVTRPGSDFTTELQIAGARRIATAEYVIRYNPAVLRVNRVSPESMNASINAASGLIHVSHVFPQPGVLDTGLAQLHCSAIAEGTSTLDVDPINIRRASDNGELDIHAPRHLERLCQAYRTQVGDWLEAIRELEKQLETSRSELEASILQGHINRTVTEIDIRVLNHALAAFMAEYGQPPENLDQLLGAQDILSLILRLSEQTRLAVTQVYLKNHPEVDPRSEDLLYRVWGDPATATDVFKQYPALWNALSPYFKWIHSRDPKDPARTEEDVPLMVDELRQIYDISFILSYRFVRKYNRPPQSHEELLSLGFRALEDPNTVPGDPARQYTYTIIDTAGKPQVQSTFSLYMERDVALGTLNERMAVVQNNFNIDPEKSPMPVDINDFYARYAQDLLSLRDPFGKDFVLNTTTWRIEIDENSIAEQ